MRRYWAAVITANRKPLQAAVRSKAAALTAPRRACSRGAAPNRSSGVDVASRIRSRLSADQPAMARARSAAKPLSSLRLSPGPITRRAAIPVRLRIHSSLVSTRRPSSALLIDRDGVALPQPLSFTPPVLRSCSTKADGHRVASVNHSRSEEPPDRPSRHGWRRSGRCAGHSPPTGPCCCHGRSPLRRSPQATGHRRVQHGRAVS